MTSLSTLKAAAAAFAFAVRDARDTSIDAADLWSHMSAEQREAAVNGMRAGLLAVAEEADLDNVTRGAAVAQTAADMTRAAEELGRPEILEWRDLLIALLGANGDLREQRDEARGVVRDTLWMARRYADGRATHAVYTYNSAVEVARRGGYASAPEADGTFLARLDTPLTDPLADLVADTIAWQFETFGPGERTAGVLAHMRKEMVEIAAKPDDLVEWVDMIFLAVNGAARMGHSATAIVRCWAAKLAKNKARIWPDWRTMPPDAPIEHDRSGEAAS